MKKASWIVRSLADRMASHALFRITITHRDAPQFPDFYDPEVQPSPEMELGTFDLKADGNELCVKVIGANDKAIPAYIFGLDNLLLKPVE